MFEAMIDVGDDILEGLKKGISDKWHGFISWLNTKWTGMVDSVKNFFGIRSPSTLFAGVGTDMMAGLAGGIDVAAADVIGNLDTLATGITETMAKALSAHETAIIDYQNSLKGSMRDWIEEQQGYFAENKRQFDDYQQFLKDKAQKIADDARDVAEAWHKAHLAAGGQLTPDGSHVIMPPSSTPQPSKPSLGDAWGAKMFKQALLSDTGNMGAFGDFATFLRDVGGAFTGAGMVGAGTTGLVAQIESSIANNASSATIIALLEKLVLAVQSGGLGARFQIGGLDTSGDSLSDLRSLVQYLNAFYG
jgi:hypothetical protein